MDISSLLPAWTGALAFATLHMNALHVSRHFGQGFGHGVGVELLQSSYRLVHSVGVQKTLLSRNYFCEKFL